MDKGEAIPHRVETRDFSIPHLFQHAETSQQEIAIQFHHFHCFNYIVFPDDVFHLQGINGWLEARQRHIILKGIGGWNWSRGTTVASAARLSLKSRIQVKMGGAYSGRGSFYLQASSWMVSHQ